MLLSIVVPMNYNLINSQEVAQSPTTTIRAELTVTERTLGEHFTCANVNSVRIKSWGDRDFWQAVNQVNPQLIRIPGGEVSSYWDWRKGGLVDDISQFPQGLAEFLANPRDRRYNASKLEDYSSAFIDNQITPIFVLNMLSDDLSSQLEMLKTARDLGLPIKYIELGNEYYFPTQNYRSVFPSIKKYTEAANIWLEALRQEFPQAQIAIIGSNRPDDGSSSRMGRWNREVIARSLPLADGITIHTYGNNGLGDRPLNSKSYPYFQSADIPFILGEPFRNWQKISAIIHNFPSQKQIWITEYNLSEDINTTKSAKRQRVAGSWLHGLYTVSMSLLFLEDPRIDIACNHMLIGSSQFATILAHQNSILDPSNPQATNEPLTLSATGYTQQFLGDVTQGMTKAQRIYFNRNYSLKGNDNYYYPALYGWAFSDGKQRKSLLLNLSAQPLEINISSLASGAVDYHTIHGSPRVLVTNSAQLDQQTGTTRHNLVLPPYSITKLTDVQAAVNSKQ